MACARFFYAYLSLSSQQISFISVFCQNFTSRFSFFLKNFFCDLLAMKKARAFEGTGFKKHKIAYLLYIRSTYSMAEAAISSEAVAIPVKNMTDTKTKAAATTAANFLNISISPSGQTPFAHLLQVYSPKAQMSKCKL